MSQKDILKRIAAVLVVSSLAVSLAACGGKSDANRKSSIVDSDSPIESSVKDKKDKDRDSKDDEVKNDDSTDAKSGSENGKASSNDDSAAVDNSGGRYSEGKLDSKTFESEYIGMKFNLPDGYTMYDREQVNTMMEQMVGDSDTVSDMSYETIIHSENGDVQVIIAVDHNKEPYSPEQYLAGIVNGYKQVESAEIDESIKDASIAGMEFVAVEIDVGENSMLHCVRKKGSDMIYFVITYPKDNIDAVQKVMNSFVPINAD